MVAAVAVNNNDNDAATAANNNDVDDDPDDDDDDDDDQICQEAMENLQNRLKFPSRLRDPTIVRFAQQFIRNVQNNMHKMVTDTLKVDRGMMCAYPLNFLLHIQDDDTTIICNVRAVSLFV